MYTKLMKRQKCTRKC